MSVFYQPDLRNGSLFLVEEEAHHCTKVLRQKPGDLIQVTDGKGMMASAQLEQVSTKRCTFTLVEEKAVPPPLPIIHIAVAPTKQTDRMEWFVEKATEIGIQKISFFQSEHSERSHLKTDRIYKKAISALKQSQGAWLPEITTDLKFDDLLAGLKEEERFIAYVDYENPQHLMQKASPEQDKVVLIGPEGDFSKEELEKALKAGFVKVNLGPKRLRTETAALYACTVCNLVTLQ